LPIYATSSRQPGNTKSRSISIESDEKRLFLASKRPEPAAAFNPPEDSYIIASIETSKGSYRTINDFLWHANAVHVNNS